jgi:hypothetical protein
MKQSEIKIGGRYFANIGAELAAVIVIAEVEPSRFDKGTHTRYRIRREDSTTPLNKPRTAAALRLENRRQF